MIARRMLQMAKNKLKKRVKKTDLKKDKFAVAGAASAITKRRNKLSKIN